MNIGLLQKLSTLYGINFSKIGEYYEIGYRNKNYRMYDSDGNTYNLIIYKKEKDILKTIRRANYVAKYLSLLGFPVRTAIKTTDKKEILTLSSKISNTHLNTSSTDNEHIHYASLYNYLPGNTIPWECYTMKHIKLIGWFMSDMHFELGTTKAEGILSTKDKKAVIKLEYELGFPFAFEIIKNQMARMYDYFRQKEVLLAMEKKLNLKFDLDNFLLLARHIEKIQESLSVLAIQTILHMDLVRGNIIFAQSEEIQNSKFKIQKDLKAYSLELTALSGVIDFEKVAIGPGIVDVARTLAFLLVDCKYKDEEKIRKYFIQSGYEKRGANTLKDPVNQYQYLETLMLFFWLYDFYKFLRHNPYEFLKDNEHFVRTRSKVIAKNILKWS
jgi:Ser/Thr protein kinase RdoA (MazF antagonist)